MIFQSFDQLGLYDRIGSRVRIIDLIGSCDIECCIITDRFNYRLGFKCYSKILSHLFYIYWLIKSYIIAAASFEFNSFMEPIEERSNTQCQYNHRDHISYFPVFNEFEFSMLKYSF